MIRTWLGCLLLVGSSTHTVSAQSESALHRSLDSAWNSLLTVWYPRALDTVYGGYRANFEYDWQPSPQQDKMIVTQARHLWTTTQAARQYPEQPLYARAAQHGFEFLRDHLWNKKYGGFYWIVDQKGIPLPSATNELMRTYGQAFGIYALAAYARYRRDEESLALAQQAFAWLDEHAHDDTYGGYVATLTEEGNPLDQLSGSSGQLPPQAFYKDQNTSIHLLEAFTELYRIWPDPHLRHRLHEMLSLVRDTMVTDVGYLRLYFLPDWTPVSYRDSSEHLREANYALDHVSFGHDIETAFLLLEASEALYGDADDTTHYVAKQLVDHTLAFGFDPKRSGIYDRGYYLPDSTSVTIIDDKKAWWAQAEGLNTLYLYAQLHPQNPVYRRAFDLLWHYTKTFVMDAEYGGWYEAGIDTYPAARKKPKGQAWKGNYHNGRALMRLLERTAQP